MNRRFFPFFIATLVIFGDQITKLWVRKAIPLYSSRVIIPGFMNLVHIKNRGIAFGLFNSFASAPTILTLISAFAVFFILYLIVVDKEGGPLFRASLGLVLGGAIGNLIDRLVWGRVTDFLDFHIGPYHWPAFNVADMAISVGGGLMLFSLLKRGTTHASHSH